VQIFARDGASFLKNPDIYGYIGNRANIIEPVNDGDTNSFNELQRMKFYELAYKDQAAYFQYGATAGAMPVPYGKDEVVYLMQNPKTDSIYGQSPIALLSDILYTLIYGSQYNLDFYMNNNMPEGFMSIIGGNEKSLKAMKQRFESVFREKDVNTGFMKRMAFRLPWTSHEVKFTPFQLDPKTMQIIEQQTWFTKIVWACFGVTPDEMGFTDNSNRATGETQSQISKDKAVKPILELLQYHINQEIMPEFGFDDLEFRFVDYNLDNEHKKYDLYQKQVNLGVMTPEMVAEAEGIDVAKVREAQEAKEDREDDVAMQGQNQNNFAETKAKTIGFEIGDTVKVATGSKTFSDKTGTVTKIMNDTTVVVRFETGVDVFNASQLVLIDMEDHDNPAFSDIKAKDPFNTTDLEKQLMRDIAISSKKVRKAIKRLQ
jgi:hypothetical protein